ncbi:MAG: hypothetical protein JSS87_07735 [Acidobacteria bacterium]|nr:hypothetical protein [Acidobacteriota bacterium]
MARLRAFRWVAVALAAVWGGHAALAETPHGLALTGIIAEWHTNADGKDFKLVRGAIDNVMESKGEFSIEDGPALMTIYRVTLQPKYWKAADALHTSLLERVKNGEPLSPEQTYSGALFLSLYSATVHEDFAATSDLLSTHAISAKTKSKSADAWKMAAIVDSLEMMSIMSPQRDGFLGELKRMAVEKQSALNDPIASRVRDYAVLKAVRLGYLPKSYQAATLKAAKSLHGAAVDAKGQDMTEAAAAMMLSSELDQAGTALLAQDKVVAMDAWFNSQRRKDPHGNEALFHYKWDDDADSGFSFFGRAFRRYGAKLTEVVDEPTYEHLKNASVYFIVSPDIPAKNPDPHYVNAKDVEAITKWVSDGGVLIMMMNDVHNTEFVHTNMLSERFGIHFNPVIKNTVEGNKWEQAKVEIPATTGVFENAHTAYMKEVCTIAVQEPAKAVLRDHLHTEGEIFIAEAKYGKGRVLAIVDPWLYNEYTDGKKLPVEYDQFAAAKDLARWALSVAK